MSYHVSEASQSRLVAAFCPGDFKPLGNKSTKPTTLEASTEEMQNVNSEESNKVAGVYSCPQDGCVRIFQRVSALEKHLSLEKCTPSPERHTVIDLAKMGYKSDPKTLNFFPGLPYSSCQGGMGSKSCQKSLSVQR